MVTSGRPMDALELLRPLAKCYPDNTDVHFFRGLAAATAANLPANHPDAPPSDLSRRALYDEAATSYRHILKNRPSLAGARLELARVLFERGRCTQPPDSLLEHLLGDDCDAAAYHFRRALAGDLPETITLAVSQILAIIQARKRVSGHFSVAAAPDTNISGGTDATSFTSRIIGFDGQPLEFAIDDQNQATSGVGIIISTSGEYRHPVKFRLRENTATRLRLGSSFYRREYGGSRFDDMVIALHAGPEVLFPLGRVGLSVRTDARWYAGRVSDYGFGPRIEGSMRLSKRLWFNGSTEWIDRRYRRVRAYNGPRLDLDLNLFMAINPAITLGGRGGWQRARAAQATLRTNTKRLGAFAATHLPPILGFTGFELGFFHDLFFTRYDAPGYTLISPAARHDRITISRMTISNDRIQLFGFAPVLSLVHERRDSNIASLFDYRRNRTEITLRRLF